MRPRAHAPHQKPLQWEAHAPQLEKSLRSNKDPAQVKNKFFFKKKVRCLLNMADALEYPSQAMTVFPRSSKKHATLCYPDGRLCFLWTNSRCFSSNAAFSRSNWAVLIRINCLVFQKKLIKRGLPPNSTINTASPPLDEDQPLVWFIQVHSPHNLFCSTLLYSIHFTARHNLFLKTEQFHYVSVEYHMQKYGQESFSATYVEPKAIT